MGPNPSTQSAMQMSVVRFVSLPLDTHKHRESFYFLNWGDEFHVKTCQDSSFASQADLPNRP